MEKNKKINLLDISEYEWVYNINSIHRPTDEILEETFKFKSENVKESLKELTILWDNLFNGPQVASMNHQVEEWVENAALLRETMEQIQKLYIHYPGIPFPDELKKLPYLGKIPGIHTVVYEQNNNLSNDLTFPELKEHMGREIIFSEAVKEDILKASQYMIEKHGACCLKWLNRDKIYPVTICRDLGAVNRYLSMDPYMLYMQEGNMISIQQALTLEHETRFFFIAGERAGQSLVRYDLTPIHDRDYIPDGFTKIYPDLLKLALEAMKSLSNGNSLSSKTCVIDVAWDVDKQKAVVVELNPIHNSGLYNLNTNLFVSLAKEHPEEFVLRKLERIRFL